LFQQSARFGFGSQAFCFYTQRRLFGGAANHEVMFESPPEVEELAIGPLVLLALDGS
jgi:hypothetical protein